MRTVTQQDPNLCVLNTFITVMRPTSYFHPKLDVPPHEHGCCRHIHTLTTEQQHVVPCKWTPYSTRRRPGTQTIICCRITITDKLSHNMYHASPAVVSTGINFNRFRRPGRRRYTHRQLELEGQQFVPYFNQTRVVRDLRQGPVRLHGPRRPRRPVLSACRTLGGNFDLRGFSNYRFHDNNAFSATVEHRWYVFTGLEMAVFVDAGKTVPEREQSTSRAELQRRHRTPSPRHGRRRAALRRGEEPRGRPVDLEHERHLAEEVLMRATAMRCALGLSSGGVVAWPGQAAAQKFFPDDPLRPRADAASGGRSRGLAT